MIMDYNISFIYRLYIHSSNKYLPRKGELIFQGLEIIIKKSFPHLSTNHHVNLISAAFSLFGDLWCLHDLHVI